MAFQLSAAVQNENLHIYRGKDVLGAKVAVVEPQKKGRKERKALADLSKAGKPSLSNASKVSSLKKHAVHGTEKNKHALKSYALPDEKIKHCNEWAEEGIEHVYFSGNDVSAVQKDLEEKFVKKKVEKVISALRGWSQMSYGQETPMKDVNEVSDDLMKLEQEPEVLLPIWGSYRDDAIFPYNEESNDPYLDGENECRRPVSDLMSTVYDDLMNLEQKPEVFLPIWRSYHDHAIFP